MNEQKLADAIVDTALKYHSEDSVYPPSLVIDKEDYSDFDMAIVRSMLEKEGFLLVDGREAPEPFSQMDEDFKSRKWYAYRPNV
jgi:hypothetical protein